MTVLKPDPVPTACPLAMGLAKAVSLVLSSALHSSDLAIPSYKGDNLPCKSLFWIFFSKSILYAGQHL